MSTHILRGIAIGLWVLAGLAFLLAALLPVSAGTRIAGPALLALAVAWTALVPRSASAPPPPLRGRGGPGRAPGKERGRNRAVLCWTALGVLVALAVAVVIIRTGDRRSFLFAAFAALVAGVLAWHAYRDDRREVW